MQALSLQRGFSSTSTEPPVELGLTGEDNEATPSDLLFDKEGDEVGLTREDNEHIPSDLLFNREGRASDAVQKVQASASMDALGFRTPIEKQATQAAGDFRLVYEKDKDSISRHEIVEYRRFKAFWLESSIKSFRRVKARQWKKKMRERS
ncbi:hypothetical protein NE237_022511 [Protea cynaroides]|uniref:Uncharacterized protein n=1 Tax=Protea cynaroides TaxID=273540 RepID=A0A9Q0H9W2_9MAGN|nr:hypothetical protein NE237_022511 [Protea cynaroides]